MSTAGRRTSISDPARRIRREVREVAANALRVAPARPQFDPHRRALRAERFTALKIAALDRGFLSWAAATLVGSGASLRRWEAAFGGRLAGVVEGEAAAGDTASGKEPLPLETPVPLVIALLSLKARERWRGSPDVQRDGKRARDFIFVA